MERLGISNQTLQQFLDSPFGLPDKSQKHLKYESRYQSYKRSNKIKLEGAHELDGNYFVHLKVPSESTKSDLVYDVVVQFFPPNEKVSHDLDVGNYYVQFFSNSPGFVYKYAALYKLQGYLIESLIDKLGREALDKLPDKANSTYDLYYDSTIYYVCRYLIDNRIFVLGKLNLKMRRKSFDNFFEGIADFESVNMERDVSQLKKDITKEIQKDRKLSEREETLLKKKNPHIGDSIRKKRTGKSSTFKNQGMNTVIKTATSGTGKRTVKVISSKPKKGASKTTRKKH